MNYHDFRICASEIGGLLGYFGARVQLNTIYKVWRKSVCKKTTPRGQNCYLDEEQELANQLKISQELTQLNKLASRCETQQEIDSVIAEGTRIFSKTTIPEDKKPIADRFMRKIKNHANRAYGINAEKIFIAQFNLIHKTHIKKDNMTYSKDIDSKLNHDLSWCLDGRIDGLHNDMIVEIKHRTNIIDEVLNESDLIQLHVYMFLLNKSEAKLIQCVRRDNWHYSEQTIIYFNTAFWVVLVNKIEKILNIIIKLHYDEFSRECFLKLSDNVQIMTIQKYVPFFDIKNELK